MKKFFFSLLSFIIYSQGYAQESLQTSETTHQKVAFFTQDDCLFIKSPVPKKGIVCSNRERALRFAKKLDNPQKEESSWGPFVIKGTYKDTPMFIACAPVGSGSGLLFTELFTSGAEYVIRYGSDDIKSPNQNDFHIVKIVDEADSLVGFSLQSGIPLEECGSTVFASKKIVDTLTETAKEKGINHEFRVCHHLENYHALRNPDRLSAQRSQNIHALLDKMNENPKKPSFDMETAVLFQIAQDFNQHAATVLQTFNKENISTEEELQNAQQMLNMEEYVFFEYLLDSLIKL